MTDSLFTKIIKGEIPSHKLYEDDRTYALMDIYPVRPGMALVVTKAQVENIEDLSDEDFAALWDTVKKLARKQREVFPEAKKIAIQVEGLDVPHVHVKLFPIDSADDFRSLPDTSREPDHAALAEMAKKLQLA